MAFRAVLVVLLAIFVTGCGTTIPSDPDGTLADIRGGTLHAGASLSEGLVREASDGTLRGPLIDLVEEFADEQAATVEWTIDSEEILVQMLESGDLDLVVGGMTDQSPWSDRAGMTRGYPDIEGADGRSLVMLVPSGENLLLTTLEEFLDHSFEHEAES